MDSADLEMKLRETKNKRRRIIVTDGVFSMDGDIADLRSICDLADKYKALVVIDDSHATGFIGPNGKGTHEYNNVMGRVDIITGTLGKALGGAAGGFTSGRKEIIDLFRQRSRPYLFSNSLTPVITAVSLTTLDLLKDTSEIRETLRNNTAYFREQIVKMGFDVRSGTHPIVPVMLYNAKIAKQMAKDLFSEGIYVVAFSYPVVPEGKARIRVQISAAHTREQLNAVLHAFQKIGEKHGVIKKYVSA